MRKIRVSTSKILLTALCAAVMFAGGGRTALADPTVGSPNVATADPLVPLPYTTPCTVTLFQNQQFADYNAKPFTFTPPTTCPGPWQKVVLSADYTVTIGRQFDRTAEIWLGGEILYFGTTEEPSSSVAPSWHIERDVTDYSALFAAPQTGHADLGNTVDSTYTGVLYGTATLAFYPLAPTVPDIAPRPDVVLPMAASVTSGTATLNQTSDQYAATFTLPTNIERAFLDVYAQSQHNDEFWYTCVPNDVSSELQSCGNTGFREGEVSIDGQPAGVVPIYPWIYTGGIDPYLWRPIPGVQTLSFEPWRVDLTPFAGAIDDGKPHTVAISVFNADQYFSVAGNLLLYLDHGATQDAGAVVSNTLAASPSPQITENLATDTGGNITGTVSVNSNRQFAISGTLNTSHGAVTTTVTQNVGFSNVQTFVVSAPLYSQHIAQTTTIDSTTTVVAGATTAIVHEQRSYPLAMNIDLPIAADGSFQQATGVDQEFVQSVSVGNMGFAQRTASLDNHVTNADTLAFDKSGNFTGHTGQTATQSYAYADPYGACYNRQIAAQAGVLTSITDGTGCGVANNQLGWFDAFHNYGSAVFGATVQLLP